MTFRRSGSRMHALAVALTVAAACSPTEAPPKPVVRLAFLQDLSVPEHVDLVSPSFLALELAVRRRLGDAAVTVEVRQYDTAGDDALALSMARDIAADPSFVLAVVAPYWEEPPAAAAELAEAGVPTISLSPVSGSPWALGASPPGDPASLWRRLVPDRAAEAALLADLATRRSAVGRPEPVCLVDDGSAYGVGLVDAIAARIGAWPVTTITDLDAESAAERTAASGCSILVWGGFPPGAKDLEAALREAGAERGRAVDLSGDGLKTTIPPTSPAGDGVVVGSVTCPCADVSIDVDLASRRFVNRYQSEHGLAPGAYAAEGYDAGRIAASAILAGAHDRASMRAAFAELRAFAGVARPYEFSAGGELLSARPGLYVAAGTRWLPLTL
jgi:branched-chain amino acid transport system substrate-binding protein